MCFLLKWGLYIALSDLASSSVTQVKYTQERRDLTDRKQQPEVGSLPKARPTEKATGKQVVITTSFRFERDFFFQLTYRSLSFICRNAHTHVVRRNTTAIRCVWVSIQTSHNQKHHKLAAHNGTLWILYVLSTCRLWHSNNSCNICPEVAGGLTENTTQMLDQNKGTKPSGFPEKGWE